jgi:poly [ADP-ribose] polymerase
LINELTSKYYTLIPHALGRAKIQPITTGHEIEQENCLLDALSNMAVTSEIMSNTSKDTNGGLLMERRLRDLQMDELTALDHGSSEFAKLQDYLVNTAGHTHCIDYDLVDIFRTHVHQKLLDYKSFKILTRLIVTSVCYGTALVPPTLVAS